MRISDWSSDVCSSDLSGVAEQAVDITAFVETFIDSKLKRGSKFRLNALGYLASQIADVAFQSGQHFILIRTQERFYENLCVDRKSTRLNSSHYCAYIMSSTARL